MLAPERKPMVPQTRQALIAGSLLALPTTVFAIWHLIWPQADLLSPRGYYLGHDFANYWTGAHLASQGQIAPLYDIEAYNALLRGWFAPADRFMNFSYPPNALPLLAPIGLLPYFAALAVWTAGGIAAFLRVALGRGVASVGVLLIVSLVLSPIVMNNVSYGQAGLWLAALFIGALRLLPARPVAAGTLIGLMTVKPQLGLVLPFVLVAIGAWRAVAAAAITSISLIAFSIALYGLEPWQAYLSVTTAQQWGFVTHMDGFYAFSMCTPYSGFRWLGFSLTAALVAHALVASIIILVTVLVARGPAAWSLKSAIIALAAVSLTPYVLTYDLAIPLAAVLWCLRERTAPLDRLQELALLGLWIAPFAVTLYLQPAGIPVASICVLAMYGLLAREALASSGSAGVYRAAPPAGRTAGERLLWSAPDGTQSL